MFKSALLLMVILTSSVVSAVAIGSTIGGLGAGSVSTTTSVSTSYSSSAATHVTSTTATSLSTTSQTSTISSESQNGTLIAQFNVGPTQPVCYVNATSRPAPPYFASVKAVVTDSAGNSATYPISWVSDGCDARGWLMVSLASGAYSLNLSECGWMGCRAALPRSFDIVTGGATYVDVSINTGIV